MKKEKIALLVLRWGLGLFLLAWGVDKLIDPEGTAKIFKGFYFTSIGIQTAYFLGVVEILLSLAILAGLWKNWTYLIGLVLHSVSTLSSIHFMIPGMWKYNHLFVAGLPVLAAFVALYMLRDKDTMWTV